MLKISKAGSLCLYLKTEIPESASWPNKGEPYGEYNLDPNADIKKVLYCVTPTKAVQEYFKANSYDLLISHHPFVTNLPQMIFHTALDCCPGGLNDMLKAAVGLKEAKHFDKNLGWHGIVDPTDLDSLCQKIESYTGQTIQGIKKSKLKSIKSVVICSGLGGLVNEEALATKADCYILGESCCSFEDSGFNAMIEIGHTASEQIGVNLFRSLLEKIGIQVDVAPIQIDRFSGEIFGGSYGHGQRKQS